MPEIHSEHYTLEVLPTQALISVRQKDASRRKRLAVATAYLYGDVAALAGIQGAHWFKAMKELGTRLFDLLNIKVIVGYVWPEHVPLYKQVPGVEVKQKWTGHVGSDEFAWIEVRRVDS